MNGSGGTGARQVGELQEIVGHGYRMPRQQVGHGATDESHALAQRQDARYYYVRGTIEKLAGLPADARTSALGFNARRKTLANALSSAAPRGSWESALAELGRSPRVRAEELSLDDFLALARGWRA